jgi:calcineurin-like phosphoesterase family protein
MIWFTSDTHFNHTNILGYGRRTHFADIDAMNDALVERWNDVVAKADTVYHLGDFAMGPKSAWPEFRRRLNGRVILVSGNHDELPLTKPHFITACGFDAVVPQAYVEYDGRRLWCAHFPTNGDDHRPERSYVRAPATEPYDIALCGHVHHLWRVADDGCINVGVDVHDYRPIGAPELVALWRRDGSRRPR